jgi:multidrug efflux pump subunit AcrA (membrane-fusion protein)
MCSGGPRAPKQVKSGPSQAQIDAQNQQLELARQQILGASQRMQSQLDQQIAAANAERETANASLAAQAAAMAAEAASAQSGPYATATTQADPAAGMALVTEPIKPKVKKPAGLTIAPGGTAAAAGAGLNIGT